MTACTAEGKYTFTINLKNLSSHKMYHRRSDFMYFTSIPGVYRIIGQSVKIFMITINK